VGDVLTLLNISINAAVRTAKRLQGRKYKGKFVSASRRNKHAGGMCSPEFPLRQRPQHQSILADGARYEWRIPVRATEARCAKIPAIVMVIRFTHVRF
jgi:hypothetical protein